MKQIAAVALYLTVIVPNQALTLELPDYSYICFSHEAVFFDKPSMIQKLKCVNTIGKEEIEQLTYNDDGTWSAILDSYNAKVQVFGQISELRPIT